MPAFVADWGSAYETGFKSASQQILELIAIQPSIAQDAKERPSLELAM